MANHLHRETLEYRESWDPEPGDVDNWIRNPKLPESCNDWSEIVIEGDIVRAPNSDELAARKIVALEKAKITKMAIIDARTATILTGGLPVAPGKIISTSIAATQNLQDLAIGSSLPGIISFPQPISTFDGGEYLIADISDLIRIAALLRDFKFAVLGEGRSLRAKVLACTTITEVDIIEDLR